MIAGLETGLGLIILALAFIVPVLIVVYLRRGQRNTPVVSQTEAPFISPDSSTSEAVLIVQSGGRVEYMNGLAREWFGLRPLPCLLMLH